MDGGSGRDVEGCGELDGFGVGGEFGLDLSVGD